jgi:hypothetical protein
MGTSIRQAHHDRPPFADDLQLLRAIPAGTCLPDGDQAAASRVCRLAGGGGGHSGTLCCTFRLQRGVDKAHPAIA